VPASGELEETVVEEEDVEEGLEDESSSISDNSIEDFGLIDLSDSSLESYSINWLMNIKLGAIMGLKSRTLLYASLNFKKCFFIR
jgi:hypothetical protein